LHSITANHHHSPWPVTTNIASQEIRSNTKNWISVKFDYDYFFGQEVLRY